MKPREITLSITTISIMTLNNMAGSLTTICIMSLSIMTLNIMHSA
jgi:hypothetical protein